jgi:hypothetical protein
VLAYHMGILVDPKSTLKLGLDLTVWGEALS